jgi:hypothetical protein
VLRSVERKMTASVSPVKSRRALLSMAKGRSTQSAYHERENTLLLSARVAAEQSGIRNLHRDAKRIQQAKRTFGAGTQLLPCGDDLWRLAKTARRSHLCA